MIPTSDIHYIAGLLEGEGWFTGQQSATGLSVRLGLRMTDRDVVERAYHLLFERPDPWPVRKDHVGVRKYISPNPHWQPQWNFQICGPRAIQWMMTIYPLMGQRRKAKIKEIICAWKQSPGITSTQFKKGSNRHPTSSLPGAKK